MFVEAGFVDSRQSRGVRHDIRLFYYTRPPRVGKPFCCGGAFFSFRDLKVREPFRVCGSPLLPATAWTGRLPCLQREGCWLRAPFTQAREMHASAICARGALGSAGRRVGSRSTPTTLLAHVRYVMHSVPFTRLLARRMYGTPGTRPWDRPANR